MWFKTTSRHNTEQPVRFDEHFLRRLERLSIQARRSLRGVPDSGEHPSTRRRPATLFSEHRAYTHGDDVRSIDWNAYARQDELHVKLGETEQELMIHVLLDVSPSMAWGAPAKLHLGQQLAAAIGYLALAHHDRLVVTPFSAQLHRAFGPASTKGNVVPLLRYLENLQPQRDTRLAPVLRDYAKAQRGGLLVICSDLLDAQGLEAGLQYLPPERWQIAVLHLMAREELRPTLSGPLELEDAETGQLLVLEANSATLNAYQRKLAEWRSQLMAACERRGASFASLLSDWPLEQAIVPYLRRRALLR